MYSVNEMINQLDQGSDVEENIEEIFEEITEVTEGHSDAEDNENNDNEDENKKTPTKVAKKPRQPSNRPKLDVERLKGPRGLMSMEKLFSKLEFQGDSHEKEDLDKVMNTLQYWCHRLFPKFSFDDTLEHLEKLGVKKPLITLKKKVLFDLMEEDQPEILVDDEIIDEPEETRNDFDTLFEQEAIPQTPIIQLTDQQKEIIEQNRLLAAERRWARLEAQKQREAEINNLQTENNSASSQDTNSEPQTSTIQLTEDQKRIIETNRLLAIEKRRALLDQQSSKISYSSMSQDSENTLSLSEEIYPVTSNNSESMHLSQLAIASQDTDLAHNSDIFQVSNSEVDPDTKNPELSELEVCDSAKSSNSLEDYNSAISTSQDSNPAMTISQTPDSFLVSDSTNIDSSQSDISKSASFSHISEMEVNSMQEFNSSQSSYTIRSSENANSTLSVMNVSNFDTTSKQGISSSQESCISNSMCIDPVSTQKENEVTDNLDMDTDV